MNPASTLLRVVRTRPFYLWKYFSETIRFSFNIVRVRVRLVGNRYVTTGRGLRTLTGSIFHVERPNASIEVGDHVVFYDRCRVSASGSGGITIGDYCSFGTSFNCCCRERIEIGSFVLVSWNVTVLDFEGHPIDPLERRDEMIHSIHSLWPPPRKRKLSPRPGYVPSFRSSPVVIEDDVWIGTGAVILKGTRIGRGSIIGAGAVVSGEIPPFSIVLGNPARVIRSIRESSGD